AGSTCAPPSSARCATAATTRCCATTRPPTSASSSPPQPRCSSTARSSSPAASPTSTACSPTTSAPIPPPAERAHSDRIDHVHIHRHDDVPQTLVGISFPDVFRAQEFLTAAARLANQGSLKVADAVILVKHDDGRVTVQETVDPQPAQS